MLEPGKYFIAFQIVGCNKEALEAYLAKPENALGKMQHIPINIGIAVKGLEYQ